jgi:integrase
MSAATKQRVRATLRSALADAEREGLVSTNAARLARLETGRRPKVRPLEPAELGKLLDHLAGDPLGPLFEVVAASGLRRGEGLAMRWDDVDLTRGVLVVRQQLLQMSGVHPCPYCADGHRGMRFEKPKTASGEARIVELDGGTVGVLLTHKLAQDAQRDRWGDAYRDHGLVFARDDGTPLYGDEATKRFGQLCDDAGV